VLPSPVPPVRSALSVASLVPLVLGCQPAPEPVSPIDSGEPYTTVEAPEGLCQIDVECYGSVLDDPKVPCALQAFDPAGAPMYEGSAGIERRGRSSQSYPKPQYAVELRGHTELPVWPGATWRYLDDGSNPGTGWRTPAYDDAGWSTGPAPLGQGMDYLQTVVDIPSSPSATTYFRKEFSVGSLGEVEKLALGLKRVDGAAVYLNGVEVVRDNLSVGAAFDTPALDPSPDRKVWRVSDLDAALLSDGPNVLAVEVHRADPEAPVVSFDLYLEASGPDQPVNLLGMGREEDWILNGQWVDRVLFRNRLAYDLYQSFGGTERYATETRFCELRFNGEYAGIYTLGEKIERDDDRVDIGAGDRPGDTFIIKNDDGGEQFRDNAVGYGFWQLEYPDPDPAATAAVSAYLDGYEDAVLGADPADPVNGIFAWLDLDSAVDWVLINELMKNQDAYFLSVHLWKDQGGRMHFAPWDLDLSLGSYPNTDCGPEGWVARTYWLDGQEYGIPFVERMAEVPAFREALTSRWRELRGGTLDEGAILALIEHYDSLIAPALEANLERWPIDEVSFTGGGTEEKLCPVSSYEEEHDSVVRFLQDRLVWMDENIDRF
jgi:hypothetical protein